MQIFSFAAGAAALVVVSSLTATTSFAEESAQSGSPVLEEILVTATRRSESVQDVPISISVVGADDIAGSGSNNVRDMSGLVPNFVFGQGNNEATSDISIRGIYSHVPPGQVGFDQGVSVYVDGVYMGKQFASNADLGQTERVEVLRGPQGTLWGKNTVAGAVNIVTRKPGNELEGGVSVELGNRSLVHVKSNVNVPLVEDRLAFRASVGHRTRGGFITNTFLDDDDVGSSEITSGRTQLRFTPGEKTTVDLNADFFTGDNVDYIFEYVSDNPFNDDVKYTKTNDFVDYTDRELFGISLSVEHLFNNGYTFTSISGWRNDDATFGADIEGNPRDIFAGTFTIKPKQFTQELRIASPADKAYDFVAGVYYFDQEADSIDVLMPGRNFPFPPAAGSANQSQTVDAESIAAFVHANYRLSDAVTLFAGLRYTDETKKLVVNPTTCPNPITCGALRFPRFTAPVDAPDDLTSREPTWSVGLRYNVDDDIMVYGSVARGFKSAAFNKSRDPVADLKANLLVADPEFVTNYEIGAKTSWMERRLQLNVAAFYMDYEDLQVRTTCIDCGPFPVLILGNAAAATSKGFELELSALATDNLLIAAGVGYSDATYDTFEGVTNNRTRMLEDASGNHIPVAPKWTLNVTVQHQARLADGTLTSRLDYSYLDDRYSIQGVLNDSYSFLPSQSLLNARLSYGPHNGNWSLSAWARNLTDNKSLIYANFRSAFGSRGGVGMYQEPRTYGISLDYRF